MTKHSDPITGQQSDATVIALAGRRRPGPPDVRARWFTADDDLCSSDHDCTADRLCVSGHCI